MQERDIWEMSLADRTLFRQKSIKPLVDRVFEIIKYQREEVLLPKNKFSQAVNYMYSRESILELSLIIHRQLLIIISLKEQLNLWSLEEKTGCFWEVKILKSQLPPF